MMNRKNYSLKIPPHNIDAEIAVLGAMAINEDAKETAISKLVPEDFYREANKIIFEAFQNIKGNDLISVISYLDKKDLLEKIGGNDYIYSIIEGVATSAGINHWIELVKDCSIRRQLIEYASNLGESSFNNNEKGTAIIESAFDNLNKISQNIHSEKSFIHIGQAINKGFNILERRSMSPGLLTGISTGFTDLDRLTAGIQPSSFTIIAGRPSMGKTALAMNIAQNVANQSKVVAVCSLEMSNEELSLRALGSDSRIDSHKFRSGMIRDNDWDKLIKSASKISNIPIYLDDSTSSKAQTIKTKCLKLQKEKGLNLIIIDYLQLMQGRGESREREISGISRILRGISKDIAPVIALSQLNRKLEDRLNKRPRLADLRESGALEQDADVVIFIYRDEVYYPHDDKNKNIAEILVEKQRNGPTGRFKLTFLKEYTRFEDHIDNKYTDSDPYTYHQPIPNWQE